MNLGKKSPKTIFCKKYTHRNYLSDILIYGVHSCMVDSNVLEFDFEDHKMHRFVEKWVKIKITLAHQSLYTRIDKFDTFCHNLCLAVYVSVGDQTAVMKGQ